MGSSAPWTLELRDWLESVPWWAYLVVVLLMVGAVAASEAGARGMFHVEHSGDRLEALYDELSVWAWKEGNAVDGSRYFGGVCEHCGAPREPGYRTCSAVCAAVLVLNDADERGEDVAGVLGSGAGGVLPRWLALEAQSGRTGICSRWPGRSGGASDGDGRLGDAGDARWAS